MVSFFTQPIDKKKKMLYSIIYTSGCGAVGSALPWGGRGRTFKSCHSDQQAVPAPNYQVWYCLF